MHVCDVFFESPSRQTQGFLQCYDGFDGCMRCSYCVRCGFTLTLPVGGIEYSVAVTKRLLGSDPCLVTRTYRVHQACMKVGSAMTSCVALVAAVELLSTLCTYSRIVRYYAMLVYTHGVNAVFVCRGSVQQTQVSVI